MIKKEKTAIFSPETQVPQNKPSNVIHSFPPMSLFEFFLKRFVNMRLGDVDRPDPHDVISMSDWRYDAMIRRRYDVDWRTWKNVSVRIVLFPKGGDLCRDLGGFVFVSVRRRTSALRASSARKQNGNEIESTEKRRRSGVGAASERRRSGVGAASKRRRSGFGTSTSLSPSRFPSAREWRRES